MEPEELPDPSEMSPQERILSLVEAIGNDDLLGVLLVLYFMEGNEINARASSTARTPLETAVVLPTSRPAVRRTIAECLLHRDAIAAAALELALTHRNLEMVTLLDSWCKGGREQVEMSRRLVHEMTLEEAEAWISDAGMALEEPPAMDGIVEEQHPMQDVVMTEQGEHKPDLADLKPKTQQTSPEPPPRSLRRSHSPSPQPEEHKPDLAALGATMQQASPETCRSRPPMPAPRPTRRSHSLSPPKMKQSSAEPTPVTRHAQPAPALPPASAETPRSRSPTPPLESTRHSRSPPPPSSSAPFEPHALSISSLPSDFGEADVRELVAKIVDPDMVSAVHLMRRKERKQTAVVVVCSERGRDQVVKSLHRTRVRKRRIFAEPTPLPAWTYARRRSLSPRIRRKRSASPSYRSRSPVRRLDEHGDPFLASSRRSLSSSPPPPGPLSWMYVGNLPTTLAERHLYDQLTAARVRVEDIYLKHNRTGSRTAFVELRTDSDVCRAIEVLNGLSGLIEARPYLDPKTGKTEPGFASSRTTVRNMYQGPRRNSRAPPSTDTREVLIQHLAPGTTTDLVVSFLEGAIGRGGVRELLVREVRGTRDFLRASASLDSHQDCVRAILDLDGEVCNGYAVSITWDQDPARTRPAQSSLPEYARASPSPAEVAAPPPPSNGAAASPPTAPRRSPPPSTSTSCRRDSPPRASTSNHRRSPSPPRRSSSPTTAAARAHQAQLELDLSRLSSLDFRPPDLLAIQRLWAPLSSPPDPQPQQTTPSTPSSDLNQGPSVERQISVPAKFGFLPQEEAKRALERVKGGERVYTDDETQSAYERFLRAQAGENRDHYVDFFARLFDFNQANARFAEQGRQQAATADRIADNQDRLAPRHLATNGHSHARN
ncbi:hypothetical protein JCM5296_007250 [Sporobolomyces johnsonii]